MKSGIWYISLSNALLPFQWTQISYKSQRPTTLLFGVTMSILATHTLTSSVDCHYIVASFSTCPCPRYKLAFNHNPCGNVTTIHYLSQQVDYKMLFHSSHLWNSIFWITWNLMFGLNCHKAQPSNTHLQEVGERSNFGSLPTSHFTNTTFHLLCPMGPP